MYLSTHIYKICLSNQKIKHKIQQTLHEEILCMRTEFTADLGKKKKSNILKSIMLRKSHEMWEKISNINVIFDLHFTHYVYTLSKSGAGRLLK